jgi:subtilisin family serine protease
MKVILKPTMFTAAATAAVLWAGAAQAVMLPSEDAASKTFPTLSPEMLKELDWARQPKAWPAGRSDKIDGRLWQLLEEARTKKAADVQAKAWALNVPYDKGSVAVTLLAEPEATLDALKAAVLQSGGRVTATLDNVVYARVPLDKVQSLGERRGLYYLAPQEVFYPMVMDTPKQATLAEGVQRVKAERLHQEGIKGKGIKVGILDFGFTRYSELMRAGLVPAPKAQKAFNRAQTLDNGVVHGTGCAEIIHAMAPEADLYLAAVGEGGQAPIDQIIEAAQWLAEQGLDIISYSGGTPIGRKDGQHRLDQMVDDIVSQKKILWVNSTGNEGNSHWGGPAEDQDHDQLIDVIPGEQEVIVLQAGGQAMGVGIVWDDWGPDPRLPAASQDIDAALVAQNPNTGKLEVIAKSENPQNGRGEPREGMQIPTQPGQVYGLVMVARRVDKPVKIDVFVLGSAKIEPLVPEGSVGIPATAHSALSVGAVDVRSDELEPYSSQGPTGDGRLKPEVSAPDNIASAAYSNRGGRFSGTSAACPHVSGFAALLKQMDSSASLDKLRADVIRYVQPKGSPVPNNQYGHGRIAADNIQISQGGQPGQAPELLKPILDVLEKPATSSGSGESAQPPSAPKPPRKLEDMLRQ